jgi:ElaB/YqjD/DUF883 family membrane-anchored ribosome-binding protein
MDAPTLSPDTATRDRLAHSLQQMVEEAERLLQSAQRTGSEQFVAARDRFETQLKRARSELDALQDTAAYNVRRAARAADTAVHDHPYAAVGLGAGIGMLVGLLISRR